AIPDYMTWRHPKLAIDDPKLVDGSYRMADVRHLSTHVVKLGDMLVLYRGYVGLVQVESCLEKSDLRSSAPGCRWKSYEIMGIHDFLCLPEWTGAEVQEEPYHDIIPTLKRLPFYCTFPAAVDAALPDPTLEDLPASDPSVKVIESDDGDDACYEISIVTPICYVAVIPPSGNQSRGSVAPATEGPK
nr:hypothetical protein [Tanacetum cinerariifolium]